MGYEVWTAELVIATGHAPDWDAARQTIEAAQPADLQRSIQWDWDPLHEWLPNYPDHEDAEVEAAMARARDSLGLDLEVVKTAYEDPPAHQALAFDVAGVHVFVVGGATAGDDPHPIWGPLLNLADTGLLFAAGFTQMLSVPRAEHEAAT